MSVMAEWRGYGTSSQDVQEGRLKKILQDFLVCRVGVQL